MSEPLWTARPMPDASGWWEIVDPRGVVVTTGVPQEYATKAVDAANLNPEPIR